LGGRCRLRWLGLLWLDRFLLYDSVLIGLRVSIWIPVVFARAVISAAFRLVLLLWGLVVSTTISAIAVPTSTGTFGVEIGLLILLGLHSLFVLLLEFSLGLSSQVVDLHRASLGFFLSLLPVGVANVEHVLDEHLD